MRMLEIAEFAARILHTMAYSREQLGVDAIRIVDTRELLPDDQRVILVSAQNRELLATALVFYAAHAGDGA